jgi:hypothetical protein
MRGSEDVPLGETHGTDLVRVTTLFAFKAECCRRKLRRSRPELIARPGPGNESKSWRLPSVLLDRLFGHVTGGKDVIANLPRAGRRAQKCSCRDRVQGRPAGHWRFVFQPADHEKDAPQ